MKLILRPRTAALLVVLVSAGCASTAAAPPDPTAAPATVAAQPIELPAGAGLADVALVAADGQVAVVRNGEFGEPTDGILTPDRATLVTTNVVDGTTNITWIRLVDGSRQATTSAPGALRAVVTDGSGTHVALTAANPDAPNGTEIIVVDRDGEVFRDRYDTELQPEGFSSLVGQNGLPLGVFVQEFLDPPDADPQAPRWYQVRVLDLATGDLSLPFNLRDKSQQVDEQMLGFGRTHVQSDVNGLLFTLYRGIYDDNSEYAFVHTLGFFNGVWCLDLPRELALEWEPGALGLIDHEQSLLVVSANGFVSEFRIRDITDYGDDIEAMPVPERTVRAWDAPPAAGGPAVGTSETAILVGQDSTLRWLDPATLAEVSSLEWDMDIESVHLVDDDHGDVIAVGSGRIVQIRPDGEELLAEVPLPPGFGPVTRIVELPSEAGSG